MAQKAYVGRVEKVQNLKPLDVVQADRPDLPDLLIVDKCYPMYGTYSLQHKSVSGDFIPETSHYIPGDFEVKVLTGTKAKELLAKAESLKSLEAPYRQGMDLGSDPEIFVVDENNKVIPAWMFLGSKDKPNIAENYPTNFGQTPSPLPGGNTIYWDGFQAEFTVNHYGCLAWTLDSVQRGLAGLLKVARKHNPKAKLSNHSVAPADDKILKTAEDKYVQFGCMPSKNVYGLTGRNENGIHVPFRFAGGHIHFGLSKQTDETIKKIVRSLDAIVGVACVSLFQNQDNIVRRQYYGLAGEYRTPPHGVEYRTLSNAWMSHPLVANMVFDLARMAVSYGMSDNNGWVASENDVIDSIQNCDVDKARKILKDNEKLFEMILGRGYISPSIAARLFNGPMENFIEDPSDIEKNWVLNEPEKWITHCDGPLKNWKNSLATLQANGKV